jgi:heptosyltransferase-2
MKILITRPWGIGNMIMATPAIQAVRKLFPDAYIMVLTSHVGAECIMDWPVVNQVVVGKERDICLSGEFDYMINLNPGNEHYKITGITVREVVRYEKDQYDVDEMKSNLALISSIGEIGRRSKYKPHVDNYMHSKVIGVHAGSRENNKWKRWKYFPELLYKLCTEYRIKILGKEEDWDFGQLNYVENYLGLTFRHTVHEISRCDYFISNDSGLMHIAAALGITTLGIFGMTDVKKNPPYKQHVIRKDVKCGEYPCYLNYGGCTRCLDELTAEEVYKKFKEII